MYYSKLAKAFVGRLEKRTVRSFHLLTAGLLTVLAVHVSAQESRPKPPGAMVDIGGYKLYLDCRGEGAPLRIDRRSRR